MFTYRIEIVDRSTRRCPVAFTVFSDQHGECGVPDSRTGYGFTIAEAIADCEWGDKVTVVY